MRSGGGVLRMKHLIWPFSPYSACCVCVLEMVGGPETNNRLSSFLSDRWTACTPHQHISSLRTEMTGHTLLFLLSPICFWSSSTLRRGVRVNFCMQYFTASYSLTARKQVYNQPLNAQWVFKWSHCYSFQNKHASILFKLGSL